MDENPKQNLFIPLRPEKLVHARLFYPLQGQIIFWFEGWQDYVLTVISEDKDYTADDYSLLPEGAPYELINGKLVFMAAPNDTHQKISMRLSAQLFNYVDEKKLGEVRTAPYDVELDENNVLQPDIIFVSIKRISRIKQKLFGAPDFVVEIISVGTQNTDETFKKELYGKHGVIEYWIVHPTKEYIQVHHNGNQKMELAQTANRGDIIRSKAIAGLALEVDKIFG